MRTSRTRVALVGLGALAALTACTPGEPAVARNDQVAAADRTEPVAEGAVAEEGGGGGPVVAFAAGAEIAWDLVPEDAPAGPVTVELTCAGLPHNVTFEGVNGDAPVVECNSAGTYTGDTELEAGTYAYFCSVPGHAANMSGELAVT